MLITCCFSSPYHSNPLFLKVSHCFIWMPQILHPAQEDFEWFTFLEELYKNLISVKLCSYCYHHCISMLNLRLWKGLFFFQFLFLFLSLKQTNKQMNKQDLACSRKNNRGDKVQLKQAPDGDRECSGQDLVWMKLDMLPSTPQSLACHSHKGEGKWCQ